MNPWAAILETVIKGFIEKYAAGFIEQVAAANHDQIDAILKNYELDKDIIKKALENLKEYLCVAESAGRAVAS